MMYVICVSNFFNPGRILFHRHDDKSDRSVTFDINEASIFQSVKDAEVYISRYFSKTRQIMLYEEALIQTIINQ